MRLECSQPEQLSESSMDQMLSLSTTMTTATNTTHARKHIVSYTTVECLVIKLAESFTATILITTCSSNCVDNGQRQVKYNKLQKTQN